MKEMPAGRYWLTKDSGCALFELWPVDAKLTVRAHEEGDYWDCDSDHDPVLWGSGPLCYGGTATTPLRQLVDVSVTVVSEDTK